MSASLEASFRIPLHNGRKWHNIPGIERNGFGCALRMRSETTTIRGDIIGGSEWSRALRHTATSTYNLIIVRTCFRTPFVCACKISQRVAKLFRFAVVIIIGAAVIVVSTLNWLMMMTIKSVRFTEKKNDQHTRLHGCRNSFVISRLTNNPLLMYNEKLNVCWNRKLKFQVCERTNDWFAFF